MRRWPSRPDARSPARAPAKCAAETDAMSRGGAVRGSTTTNGKPPVAQPDQLLGRLRRQDQDRAGDAGARSAAGQHLPCWAASPALRIELPAVQVEGLGDRGDDQPEVVGQHVRAAHVDRAGDGLRPDRREGWARAGRGGRPPARPARGCRGATWLPVEHPRHGRDRHAGLRRDIAHRRPDASPWPRSCGICYIALFHARHSRPRQLAIQVVCDSAPSESSFADGRVVSVMFHG